jgi:hypothetical protein
VITSIVETLWKSGRYEIEVSAIISETGQELELSPRTIQRRSELISADGGYDNTELSGASYNGELKSGREPLMSDNTRSKIGERDSSQLSFVGCLDAVSALQIEGWACCLSKINVPVSLDLYDGDTFLTQTTAHIYRRDLENEKIGSARHGFSISTPISLIDGRSHVLRVIVSNTTFELIPDDGSI